MILSRDSRVFRGISDLISRGLKWVGVGGIICGVFNVMLLNLMIRRMGYGRKSRLERGDGV